MKAVRLLDGSFSTALKELGFDADKHAMWTGEANRICPEKVAAVYKRFLESGVDIITTNTYHACAPYKTTSGLNYNADIYVGNAIRLLRNELNSLKKCVPVLGSISCFGATLRNASEYNGSYIEDLEGIHGKMVAYYTNMFKLMTSYEVTNVIIETVPALAECDAIIAAMEAFDITAVDNLNLRHGESLLAAVGKLIGNDKIVGVGVNCTDAKNIPSLLSSIKGHTKGKDVFVYPNCGFESQTLFSDLSRNELSSQVKEWIDLGATVVGGCCGTSPGVIALMREILDQDLL